VCVCACVCVCASVCVCVCIVHQYSTGQCTDLLWMWGWCYDMDI